MIIRSFSLQLYHVFEQDTNIFVLPAAMIQEKVRYSSAIY